MVAATADATSGTYALTVFALDGGAAHDIVRGNYGRKPSWSPYTNPSWSPDGSTIAYSMSGTNEVHLIRSDGSGDRVVAAGSRAIWSPDSRRLAVIGPGPGETTLVVIDADGTGAVTLSQQAWDYPSRSPDGGRIAFVESPSGSPDRRRYLASCPAARRRFHLFRPRGRRCHSWSRIVRGAGGARAD
jgi:Tol biopolymer transport system component